MTTGILAIWNDCAPDRLSEYEAWYQGEHLAERLAIPGIHRGRRYAASGEGPGFFTYYETETPEVLVSEAYFQEVNNPSPRTRAIMSGAFLNMNRTICAVTARAGRVRGAWAVTLLLEDSTAPMPDPGALIREPGVARAEIWTAADIEEPGENTETRLRGGDGSICGCLFIETLRRADAEKIGQSYHGTLIYQFLCELAAPEFPDRPADSSDARAI